MKQLRQIHAKCNETEQCHVSVNMTSGKVIMAIAVDDFLVKAQNQGEIDELYGDVETKYNI